MKRLYLIGGTMGVGKTSVSQYLKNELTNAVFLDGDWCWDSSPFQVTNETKNMVENNICFILNSFIHCSAYDNIIFCWVLHDQSIIDTILSRIDVTNCDVKVVSLIASKETLTARIMDDVSCGKRTEDVLDRSLVRLPLYQNLNSIKINTDKKTIKEIADEVLVL